VPEIYQNESRPKIISNEFIFNPTLNKNPSSLISVLGLEQGAFCHVQIYGVPQRSLTLPDKMPVRSHKAAAAVAAAG